MLKLQAADIAVPEGGVAEEAERLFSAPTKAKEEIQDAQDDQLGNMIADDQPVAQQVAEGKEKEDEIMEWRKKNIAKSLYQKKKVVFPEKQGEEIISN